MDNIIKFSDRLYSKSQSLLGKFPFEKLAKKHFGEIELIGSAATNLMIDPDIDFNVTSSSLEKDTVLQFVADLLEIKECRKVILYNRFFEDSPYFIINLERFVYKEETWTITFFIANKDLHEVSKMKDFVLKNLDDEKRKVILKLKEFRLKQNLKREITSNLIYEAVFNNKVKDVESFKNYLNTKGVEV